MAIPMNYLEANCLVVDDESSMRITINNMMSRIGFKNIRVAEHGRKALDIIRSHPIDLVVSDINMPQMTGVELFKTVKDDRKYSNVAFVFVTAEVTRGTVARAAEDGGEAYIVKPFVMATLEDKLAKVLENKFDPDPIEQHLRNFELSLEERNLAKAEEELLLASILAPDSARVSYGFGRLAHIRGDINSAMDFFRKTIDINRMFVKAYNALAEIYENVGNMEAAVDCYEQAHRISPSNTERLLALSRLFCRMGQDEKAESMIKDAVSQGRTDVSTWGHLIGELHLSKNENDKALDTLLKAYKKNPYDLSLTRSLCEAFRKTGKPEKALELYEEMLAVAPDNAAVYHLVGRTYLEMGDRGRAAEAIRRAWELNPFSSEITADLKTLAEREKVEL
jgi:two-component system chemotaxis response regulator CheY